MDRKIDIKSLIKDIQELDDIVDNQEISDETDNNESEEDSDNVLPVLPLRDKFLFPNMVMPVTVTRDSSLRLVRKHSDNNDYIAVVCQKDSNIEFPGLYDLYPTGTLAKVMQVVELNEGITTVLLQGVGRVCLKEITKIKPYLKGEVEYLTEENEEQIKTEEFKALYES